MGTTLNFDFLLEPRDYCDHRNEERREGRRGASSGGRVSRKDKQRGASTGLSTDINHHHNLSAAPPGVGGEHYHAGGVNVKRSRSFYAAPGLANRYFFLCHSVIKSIGCLCRLCQSDTFGLIYKSNLNFQQISFQICIMRYWVGYDLLFQPVNPSSWSLTRGGIFKQARRPTSARTFLFSIQRYRDTVMCGVSGAGRCSPGTTETTDANIDCVMTLDFQKAKIIKLS